MTAALRRVAALVDAPRPEAALSVLLGTATVVFGAGLMATAGYLISRAAERPAILSLTVAIVAVRFFGLARPLTRYLERLASHDVAFRALARVRGRVFERIEPLAPGELDGFQRGDLVSRLVSDVDALQDLHLRGLQPPLVALASSAVCVGVTAALLPPAAAILAAGLALAGIAVPVLTARAGAGAAARQATARGALTGELVGLLQAAPELVVYGGERGRLDRLQDADGELVRLARRDALTAGAADGLQLAVLGATVAGVLAVAIAAHTDGRLDRVLIALLGLLALASFEAVQPLAAAGTALTAAVAAGGRVLDLVDREPRIVDPRSPAALSRGTSTVALEDVRARYAADEAPVLDGACLEIGPGARIALVGASGAGKTTVTNLLLRFLDPERGRVTIGGVDLRELRQADVRRTIAVAGQDSHLFSTSIRENVRLARPESSDAELADVLRLVGLSEWIEALPDGCDTLVGDEGRAVSGGQRQRILVARALLARPQLLVLDEPIAHLDAPAGEALIRDVFAAAGNTAVLLITHRPEGLDLVDAVFELVGSSIVPRDVTA